MNSNTIFEKIQRPWFFFKNYLKLLFFFLQIQTLGSKFCATNLHLIFENEISFDTID